MSLIDVIFIQTKKSRLPAMQNDFNGVSVSSLDFSPLGLNFKACIRLRLDYKCSLSV